MWDINEFAAITIRMASPDRIREWSRGEVKKPETINYRTLKPELEGLFCEKIFGCTKDWECFCGKYKGIRYKGVVCDRCQVEVTHSKVRRERMGSIELVAPVSHIWYFKGIPSRMGIILGMAVRDLERVLYFQDYVVVDPGATPLKEKALLDEEAYQEAREKYGSEFKADMGAEAVRELLRRIDVTELARDLREDLKTKPSKAEEKQIIRRLSVVESFARSGNKPEWMIIDVIPVIPPELRPMVQLDGGRFATSDLNDLYRRVINRNNRLKRLLDLKAPQIIVRNEKRMLQEAVDALFDNGRRGRSVKGSSSNRVLKSLSDMLKGKQGRFRQNLLGKRVDYSGRSVIVIGPELKLHQCGLPKVMALELFKPFLMRELVRRGLATNIKSAKRMVERGTKEVYEVVEDVIKDHPVLLNRAPTLHRLGIQAFEPVLIEGKAIKIHPLVCVAYNADFDGDQMAVHVPLSAEAVTEAQILMLSGHNLLSPANGKPIVSPTQDIVLGMYYLTRERESHAAPERTYADPDEALRAMEAGVIHLQSRVRVRLPPERGRRIIETTPGRLVFNQILPAGFDLDGEKYVNKTMTKSEVVRVLDRVFRRYGMTTTMRVADAVKDLGFRYATMSGLSIGADDMKVPAQKDQIVEMAMREVDTINEQYKRGIITEEEKYTKVIDLWTHVTDEVSRVMFDELESDAEGFNPVYVMADSGARGSKQQIKQLAGMRGLMADPFGKIRETPIIENFREGLSVISFFQSTNGSRKGLTDTALKTANAGYLTRRLVDVAQDVVVTIPDCGTANGIVVTAIRSGEDVYEPLRNRVLGRVAVEQVIDPRTGGAICVPGTEIDEKVADSVHTAGVEEMRIRSVLTCEADRGVCQMCYGRDLASGRLAEIGEAVGVIAGQSIGEPGTQLTLRTFHVGGTASAEDAFVRARFTGTVTALPRVKKQEDGSEIVVEAAYVKGKRVERLEIVPGTSVTHVTSRGARESQPLRRGVEVKTLVKDGQEVANGARLAEVVVRVKDAGKVKVLRRDAVVVHATGKKDVRMEIPAGLRAVVQEDEKIDAGAVVARRAFDARFAGRVEVKERKGGTQIILHALAEESLSSLQEKSKFIEAEVLAGAELRVKPGDEVIVGGILGVNASYKPTIASIAGHLDFERFRVEVEGNENVIVKPDDVETEEPAAVTVWEGAEVIIDGALEVRPGQKVSEGDALGGGVKAPAGGDVHIIRRYLRRGGAEGFSVVRIVRAQQKELVPYLRYTKTSVGAARSKALSKIKKQNIRLISKAHVVAMDEWRRFDKASREWHDTLTEARVSSHKTELHGEVFPYAEFICADQARLDEARKAEERRRHAEKDVRVETGDLIIKLFSDFLRGPKEGGSEKKGMTKDITGGLPRVEELFEIRKPKATPAVLAPVDGTVLLGNKWRKSRILTIQLDDETKRHLKEAGKVEEAKDREIEIPPDRHLLLDEGEEIAAGSPLTDGPIDPHELLKVKDELAVTQYIVEEVQEVYRLQGVDIHDKHIEVIVRQMLRKVQVEDPGDTEFLPEELVDKGRFEAENRKVIEHGKRPAVSRPILLGITKASKLSDSFISAASFQETTWALTDAAIRGKRDDLRGLKENVIIGHLIPAGTGIRRYRDIKLLTPEPRILGPAVAPEVPEEAPAEAPVPTGT